MRISLQTILPGLLTLHLATALAEDAPATASTQGQLPLQELRTFTQVLDQIRQAYVEEVDDKTLLENAIIGMLTELDPHSTYLTEEAFGDLQEHSSGEFGGLGIEVGMENGMVKVIAPIDDTPAARAGIKAGDLIIKLDENVVQGMNLQEAVQLMRGEIGEPINLTVIREDEEQPLEFTVVRDIIKVRSVRSKTLEPGYGYVRIAQFQEHTGQQFRQSIKELQAKQPLKGLVLDLRNNPGGLLTASVEVADALLDSGTVVSTKGRMKTTSTSYDATPGDLLQGLPVVAIINGGSASAAEIVAGAIQDQRRGLVIGTTSFGKGSVQTVLPISEGRAIKLTTARYFTPSGRSIQAEGITPDIIVREAELSYIKDRPRLSEKNLSGHLENNQKGETNEKVRDFNDDFQLLEALNLLKAASLLQQKSAN